MMPLLAMVPSVSLSFGDTNHGAMLFLAITAYVLIFPIRVERDRHGTGLLRICAVSGSARRLTASFQVALPAVIAETRSGILPFGFGWSAAIAAEVLGQRYGRGRITWNAQFFERTNGLALVGVIALALAAVTYGFARRLLTWVTRWAE